MAIRKILRIDNAEELAILRKKSKMVDSFDARLNVLIEDMIDTMKKADGAGLSAVQVGVLKRVFVVATKDGVQEFINPEILETSGECPILEEGCLSVPGRYGKVKRPNKVVIRAKDKHGNEGYFVVKMDLLEKSVLDMFSETTDNNLIVFLQSLSFAFRSTASRIT